MKKRFYLGTHAPHWFEEYDTFFDAKRDKQIITDLRKKIERLEVINKELNEIICNK